ncbi:MAG: glutamate 5-kinase [Lachnospiraceae bacterium]|nr:glutamate 5-kinase [Lachnospiraceae bacterium]
MNYTRENIKDTKRIVVKVGSSTITRFENGSPNLLRIEKLVRELCTQKGEGREVILVSSGAIAVGRNSIGHDKPSDDLLIRQGYAAIGQGRLMMIYQKLFAEYGQTAAQVLLTMEGLDKEETKNNAIGTLKTLLRLGSIPIVNENDTVSPYEILYGDNDTLSSIVATLVDADLLILLYDIDGFYTDDPNLNPEAELIETVETLDAKMFSMGKDSSGDVGTGGMATKLSAAKLATEAGIPMIIANGDDLNNIHRIMNGKPIGTLFLPK